MITSTRLRAGLCVAALALVSLAASASAQIVNGGFEAGDFTGWTVNDPSDFTLVGSNPALAHSGLWKAYLGADPLGSLSQTFSTFAGQTYTLSFWLAVDNISGPDNYFEVFWNGSSIYSATNVPTQNYVNISLPNLSATAATSTIEFRYRHSDDYFRLDDVSVSVVPEPSTFALAAIGLGLVAVGVRRRVRA